MAQQAVAGTQDKVMASTQADISKRRRSSLNKFLGGKFAKKHQSSHEDHNPEKKDKGALAQAFHEVHAHEPSTVQRANVSGERKKKMLVAIALAKARKAGARVPKP